MSESHMGATVPCMHAHQCYIIARVLQEGSIHNETRYCRVDKSRHSSLHPLCPV